MSAQVDRFGQLVHRFTRSRIAARARIANAGLKRAEADKRDFLAFAQVRLHRIDERVD